MNKKAIIATIALLGLTACKDSGEPAPEPEPVAILYTISGQARNGHACVNEYKVARFNWISYNAALRVETTDGKKIYTSNYTLFIK